MKSNIIAEIRLRVSRARQSHPVDTALTLSSSGGKPQHALAGAAIDSGSEAPGEEAPTCPILRESAAGLGHAA